MSYLALARKWRPRTFSQMVGQEHINKALINALNQQRLHHAYLFTGTRGTGKTSIARILAKALNCEQGISSEPCLRCESCIAIEQGRFIDLIEIDAASRTRVEDTREMLDNVQYACTNARFKIYLIDEVHMLSGHSFNALLKTLEEPPAHVKFILATTDVQKLPMTVLSRCLQFNLKNLPTPLITQQLQLILQDEQLDFDRDALELLAKAGRGSMRDALSLLDQAILGADKKLKLQDVTMMLGYTQLDYALLLLKALATQNPKELLDLTQKIESEGGHFHYVLDELQNYLHQITVYQLIGDPNPLISPITEIKALASQFSAEDVQLFYQIVIKGREEIHLAPMLSIGFSMTLLRMLTFRPAPKAATPDLAFQNHRNALALIPQEEPTSSLLESPRYANQPAIDNKKISSPMRPEISPLHWADIIPQLHLSGLALNALEHAAFISKVKHKITLAIEKGHKSLFTSSTIARIESALSDYCQDPIQLILDTEQVVTTPAQQKQEISQQEQQKAEAILLNDSVFQQIKQDFSAELVKNSIVLLKDEL